MIFLHIWNLVECCEHNAKWADKSDLRLFQQFYHSTHVDMIRVPLATEYSLILFLAHYRKTRMEMQWINLDMYTVTGMSYGRR